MKRPNVNDSSSYLTPQARQKLQTFEDKCKRIIEMQIVAKADQSVLESNRLALWDLMWVYLKLLVAEHNLHKPESDQIGRSIQLEIEALESDLNKDDLSDAGTRTQASHPGHLEETVEKH